MKGIETSSGRHDVARVVALLAGLAVASLGEPCVAQERVPRDLPDPASLVLIGEAPADTASFPAAPATRHVRAFDHATLRRLPVRDLVEVVALLAGAGLERVRGLREPSPDPTLLIRGGEGVDWLVDGFSWRDPMAGLAAPRIPIDAIERIELEPGDGDASEGGTSAGVVRITTRRGAGALHASAEAVSDALAGDWIGAGRFRQDVFEGFAGGALIPGSDRLRISAAGQRRSLGDRSPGYVPEALADDARRLGAAPFEDGRTPQNGLSGWSGIATLGWRPTTTWSLDLGTHGRTETWRDFSTPYAFDDAHVAKTWDREASAWGRLTGPIGAGITAQASLRWFRSERTRGDGMFFDDFPSYWDPDGNPSISFDRPWFWLPGHVVPELQRRHSSYGEGELRLARAWGEHATSFGASVRRHILRSWRGRLFDVTPDSTGAFGSVRSEGYGYDALAREETDDARHPVTSALWLQDRFARGPLAVDVGVRLDAYDARTEDRTFVYDGFEFAAVPTGEETHHLTASPRLGLGFAAREGTNLRARYGEYVQLPNLADLNVDYDYARQRFATQGVQPSGSPALDPERVTAFEFGVTQRLPERSALDLAVWQREGRDLIVSGRNRDRSTIRGLDVAYSLPPWRHVRVDAAYTWSKADGELTLGAGERNIAWTAFAPPTVDVALATDRRHDLSLDVDVRAARGEGPEWAGVRWLEDTGLNVLVTAGSGTSYTPTTVYDEVTLAAVAVQPIDEMNARKRPWTTRVDLKATREFRIASVGLEAAITVINLFDRHNASQVYTGTGSPYTTGWLATPDGEAAMNFAGPDGPALYDVAQSRPTMFDVPRMARFGIRVAF